MRKRRERDVAALFRAGTPIDRALRKGVRAAITAHERAGQPIAIYRRGKVVLVPARKLRDRGA
jgi:hypothetical protein